MYTFPELIKKIRDEGDLTQEEFAKALGVSTILISMIETGQKEVSKSFVEKLANKLGVQPSSIIPFVFINKNKGKISGIEQTLVSLGEQLQTYLIKVRAKKLREYV